jgi:NAD(P)-dependent dehydrogenase (short-subunit alcohol dehydrogenase family)
VFPAGAVALVTGASRGLGAAVAIELARLGAHVVLTARTQGGLEETDDAIRALGAEATLLPLDLREPIQIDAIGPTLYQRFGRLDALAHCAATLGKLTPIGHIQPEDWNEVAAVNLAATWRLIRTCDPLLRHGPAGRAVVATDRRASEPTAYWGPYGATKAAMEHLALTWAAEAATTRLRVNLFDPGPIRTRLRSQAFPGEDFSKLALPATVAPGMAALLLPSETRNGVVARWGEVVSLRRH